MAEICRIALPLTHPSSVNAWLLRGRPMTLLDTGPASEPAMSALEAGLSAHGTRIEEIELILVTHHHHDHVGQAAVVRRRSGAPIAVLDRVADYCEAYAERVADDRAYSCRVMLAHGVPAATIEADEMFWRQMTDGSESFTADRRLHDGDVIEAGDRQLRVNFRPGHSTTDTLFVDAAENVALVGDHLLADISSNTEMYPDGAPDGRRPRSRIAYLNNLRRTAALPLRRLYPGHGSEFTDHAALIASRLRDHDERCRRLCELLADGPLTAYELAGSLWSPATVSGQPLLVVWEVLGHLDLLTREGAVNESIGDDRIHRYALTAHPEPPRRSQSDDTITAEPV